MRIAGTGLRRSRHRQDGRRAQRARGDL